MRQGCMCRFVLPVCWGISVSIPVYLSKIFPCPWANCKKALSNSEIAFRIEVKEVQNRIEYSLPHFSLYGLPKQVCSKSSNQAAMSSGAATKLCNCTSLCRT